MNKLGQIGETLTWVAGFTIIFFCSLIFLAGIIGISSKRETSINAPVVLTNDKIESQKIMSRFYEGVMEIDGKKILVKDELKYIKTVRDEKIGTAIAKKISDENRKRFPQSLCYFVNVSNFEAASIEGFTNKPAEVMYGPTYPNLRELNFLKTLRAEKGNSFYAINSTFEYDEIKFFYGECG